MTAPALGLPDLTKPFELFDAEAGNVEEACGLCLQTAGQREQRMARMLVSGCCNCSTNPRGQEAHE